jgi:RsiW-degrading membrane proteinase PrsW (M82 family)
VTIACILLAFGPMIFYSMIVWWLDRWEREPARLVCTVFAWGCLPAFAGALILQVLAHLFLAGSDASSSTAAMATITTVVAPVTEELLKAVPLLALMVIGRNEIDSWYDGVVYGAIAGFGFAAIENMFYFLQSATLDGGVAGLARSALARAVAFGPLHALCSAMTGAGCAAGCLATTRLGRVSWPIAGIVAAVACHSLHNVVVGSHGDAITAWAVTTWTGVASLLALAVLSVARQREVILSFLESEIAAGTLTRREAQAAFMPRRIALNTILPVRGTCSIARRYHALTTAAADLAFARYRQQRFGNRPGDDARIAALRARVRTVCELLHATT